MFSMIWFVSKPNNAALSLPSVTSVFNICPPSEEHVFSAGESTPSAADYSVAALRLSSPAFSFGGRVDIASRKMTPGPGSYDVNGGDTRKGFVMGSSKRGLKAGREVEHLSKAFHTRDSW
jgi:hypothetical protein